MSKRKLREQGKSAPPTELATRDTTVSLLMERLAELELALENQGFTRVLGGQEEWQFSRDFLKRVMGLARLMFLKNPLVKRLVEVQRLYVWSLGLEIKTKHPVVREVIDDFLQDVKNEDVIGSRTSKERLEEELQVTGNLFFAFFINKKDGRVRIRTVDVDEIAEIRSNPEDGCEPWFYRRVYNVTGSAAQPLIQKVVWYPDWRYEPKTRQAEIDGDPIEWDVPIYHIKVGGLNRMRFGVPEIYSALDWAIAYKTFLENWSTIMSAYARLAMQVSGLRGSKGIAAAKSKFATGLTSTSAQETNPPNVAGGWFMSAPGVDVKAIKTAGATTSAEEGRPLRLMVAAGGGLPDTFLGDVDVGNFATSQTLDRPTELRMVSRQKLWADILVNILQYVIQWSVRSPGGKLRELGATAIREYDALDGVFRYTIKMPINSDDAGGEVGKPVSRDIQVVFPSILDRNVSERVRACVGAFTLLGNQPTDIINDRRIIARYLLEALGEPNVDKVIDELYPPGEPVEPIPPPQPKVAAPAPGQGDGMDGDMPDGGMMNGKPGQPARKGKANNAPDGAGTQQRRPAGRR